MSKVFAYYWDGELRGARLVFQLLRRLPGAREQYLLTAHLADETKHAALWAELCAEFGVKLHLDEPGYHERLAAKIPRPKSTLDLVALSVVTEQSVLARYSRHMKREENQRVLGVLRSVTADEGWHIEWMRGLGKELDCVEFVNRVELYRDADREAWRELELMEASW